VKVVCLTEDGDFRARTAQWTTSSAVLSAFGHEDKIFSICCSADSFCKTFWRILSQMFFISLVTSTVTPTNISKARWTSAERLSLKQEIDEPVQ
jgi:hypothetical protein